MKTEQAIIRTLEGKAKVPQQTGSFQYPSEKQRVKSLKKDFRNSKPIQNTASQNAYFAHAINLKGKFLPYNSKGTANLTY